MATLRITSKLLSGNGIFSASPFLKLKFFIFLWSVVESDIAVLEKSNPTIDFGLWYLATKEAPPPLPDPTSKTLSPLIGIWEATKS